MRISAILSPLLFAVLLAGFALAEQGPVACPACGCAKTRKICKLVCEMQEDIDYEYDVDRDDYCLPATSEICGRKWVPDCKSWFGYRKKLIWQPHCQCKIHTRKTLVKIPVVKKVPVYNCVVECVCCDCGKSHVDAQATAQARRLGIMPDSAEKPIVFETGEAVTVFTSETGPGSYGTISR